MKSLTLDKWTDEQIESMRSKGNAKVNLTYNPNPERFPFPSNPRYLRYIYFSEVQQYIADKYERKLFMNSPNVPSKTASISRITESQSQWCSQQLEENGPSIKELLTQMHQMGFGNTKLCMEAIRIKGKNIDDIVEYVIEREISNEQPERPKIAKEEILEESRTSSKETIHYENEYHHNYHQPMVTNNPSFPFEDEMNPWAGLANDEIARKASSGQQQHPFEPIEDPFKRK